MQSVDAVLRQAAADLDAIGAHWATEADLGEARASAARIQERGYNRGQNLPEDLSAIISQAQE